MAFVISLIPLYRKITAVLLVGSMHTLIATTESLDTSNVGLNFDCPKIAIFPKSANGRSEELSSKENRKPPPTNFSPPAYCYGFLTGFNYQYLQLTQQGLGLVFVETSTPGVSGVDVNAEMFKPGWRSAYDVTLGLVTPSAWNVNFDYFLLYNKGNNFQNVKNTTFEDFAWQWNNFFNRFTLLFSKDCTPGRVEGANSEGRGGVFRSQKGCLSTIAFFALTYAFETQWFNVDSTAFVDPVTTTSLEETTQKWWAVGPYSGMELVLPLPYINYLSFVLLSGMAILPSKTKTYKNLQETTIEGGIVTSDANIHAKNSSPAISTMFDFVLGIRLSLPYFFLQIAWSGEIWPNHLQLFDYNTAFTPLPPPLTQSNYSTSGLSITGGLVF